MPLYGLIPLTLVAAVLYSTVGHGGASGYLAAMALAGMPPGEMKPTALALNLLVSGLGAYRFIRAKCFDWKVFWPCALGSVPMAYLGGLAATTDEVYELLLAGFLVISATALLLPRPENRPERRFLWWAGALIGSAIGYVSGLIGVGGGIFLSPILILSGWTHTRTASGIAAPFIFVNSGAGLFGDYVRNNASVSHLSPILPWLAIAAFVGGLIGTELGARRLAPSWLRVVLSGVMLVAAGKLAFT